MMFTKPMWLYGAGMALEGFRRGTIGGSMLALFVIKEFGLEGQAIPTLDFLRKEIEFEDAVIDEIPPPLFFIATPEIDYHEAAKTTLKVFEILAAEQAPQTCEHFWKGGDIE